MSIVPGRLGHKLGAVLLVLMLSVAIATESLVYFGFERTQENARKSSQAGLEDLGIRLITEMARSQATLGVQQLDNASRLGQEMARYVVDFKALGGSIEWDASRLIRGEDGQQYDPATTRLSDVFIPSDIEITEKVIADVVDSAALDAVFPALFQQDAQAEAEEQEGFDAVALFFHSVNHVVRYYPPIGLAEIVPPDLRLNADLERAGPENNPERRTVWSDPYEDEAGQGLLITAMTPIYEDGEYRGRIGVDISMDWLAQQINLSQPTPSGFAFYVDRTGNLLQSSGQGILSRNLETGDSDLAAVFESMKQTESGATRISLDGEEYFVAYSAFGDIGGSFGVAAPVAEIAEQAAAITASINREGNQTVVVVISVITGLFLAALAGATWMNRQLLIKPIEALVAGTQSVAQGNLDVRIPARGNDEMASLAQSFNQMTDEIRERRDALQGEVQQRKAAQNELQALFSAMTDIVLVIDQEGRYLQVPSTGAPGFLQASDGLVGRTMYDVMRAEQAEFFVTKVKDAVRLQETQTFEYPFVVEGSERWFSAAVSPMSGGVAVVVQRDVTTIKQNEQALASWQERQLTMVNSVDAILWEAPADFSCFTFVSEQAERLLGYPLEHWMNEPSFWADHIHPDDREWCVNFCLMKTAEGQDHDFEYRLIAADGRTVWLRDIVSVVMEEGKPVALRGVMVDITQLKQAFTQLSDQEQEYRAVFEATSDGIVITDPEAGVLVAANPAFCRMHGYEDMKGMRPYEFIHPESHKLFEKFREDLMSGKEFRSRAQDVRKDGSVFDVEVLGRGFTYKGKSALLGVVRDVTEETRAFQLLEQRVAERTRELESLLGVTRAVASTLDMNGLVRLVLQQLKEVVDYRAASLILVDNEDLVVYDLVEATTEGVVGQSAGIRFRRPSSSSNWQATSSSHSSLDFPCVQVAASEKFWQQIEAQSSVIVRDVLTSEDELAMAYRETMGDRLIENPQLATVRSWMAVPLTVKNQVTGYIGVSSEQPGYFSEKHVQMVRAFADYASVAIENAQLYEQAHEAAASEERQRLARELHDAVTQTLFSTSLIAEVVPSLWETKPELARQRLEDMRRLTRGALAEMRTLLLELRPGTLTELPLTDLLRQLSEATAGRTSLKIRLDLATESPVTLPGEVQVALYRIAQEALNNVVRHAGAKGATVRLAYEDGDACLQISDDGRGFDVTAIPGGHLGVGIMRERAETIGASIELESSPENGTSITVVWSATKGDRG